MQNSYFLLGYLIFFVKIVEINSGFFYFSML